MSRIAASCTIVATLVSATLAAEIERVEQEPGFYQVTTNVVTPHTPWAKPHAGGKLRVLCIAPRYSQRETIELAQRLDMEFDTVFLMNRTVLGLETAHRYQRMKGMFLDEIMAALRDKLAGEWDAIVIGGSRWSILPTEIRYLLLKQLHEGTGLVVGPLYGQASEHPYLSRIFKRELADDDSFVRTGIPWPLIAGREDVKTAADTATFIRTGALGQGRIVQFMGQPNESQFLALPSPETDITQYDYLMAAAVRAVLWAARRAPDTKTEAIRINPVVTLARDQIASTAIPITTGTLGGQRRLSVRVRSSAGELLFRSKDHGPRDIAALRFPVLPAGDHFGDVFLYDGKRVANWASFVLRVTSTSGIESLETEKAQWAPGEAIGGSAGVRNPQDGQRVVVSQIDTLGRLVARVAVPARETVRFTVEQTIRPLTVMQTIRADLVDEHGVVSRLEKIVTIPQAGDWDSDFRFVAWSMNVGGVVMYYLNQQLRRLGFDAVYDQPFHSPEHTVRHDLVYIPYATRLYPDKKTDDPLVRGPCLTSPGYREELGGLLDKVHAACAPYGTPSYSLGDETRFNKGGNDICMSPTCNADFREWLKGEYGTLDALNASWGIELTSWDEAQPITLAQAREAESIPRWVDHRRHMEYVWAGIYEFAQERLDARQPGLHVGAEGTSGGWDSFRGMDWYLQQQAKSHSGPYFIQHRFEPCRSFKKPGARFCSWYGGYLSGRYADKQRSTAWYLALRGANELWIYKSWQAGGSSVAECIVAPDLSAFDFFGASTAVYRELKTGIGQMLIHSVRQHDGVAIHYSQPSTHAMTAYGGPSTMRDLRSRWISILNGLWTNYDFVAPQQIEAGLLATRGYRALVLPYSLALSPEEESNIRDFVHSGGTLIAHYAPGLTDEHGKPRPHGALDDVLGIRSGLAPFETATATVAFERDELWSGAFLTGTDEIQEGITATGGAVVHATAGDRPAVAVNAFGKGRGVLLNLGLAVWEPFWNWKQKLDAPGQDERLKVQALVNGILQEADVRPSAEILDTTSDLPVREADVFRFANGPARYTGIMIHSAVGELDRTCRIQFAATAHLYDVRRGDYLGREDEIKTDLAVGNPVIIAQLPHRVTGVGINTSADTGVGRSLPVRVAIETDGEPLPLDFVHIDVIGPGGEPRPDYALNLRCRNGLGETTIPIALSDQPGTWRLTARHVASGVRGTVDVRISE